MIRSEIQQTAPMKRTAPAKEAKVRMRKCAVKACRAEFHPRNSTQVVCCMKCALLHISEAKAKVDRKERQAGLAALKSRTQWLREAQAAFNSFIRARDAELPCISCGRHHTGAYDAGHYRSVGAQPALRFNELNVHKQCVPCNQHKAGNVIEYRIRLIDKIGAEAVALLETEHPPMKYSIEDAKAIKAAYKAKLKAIKEAA
jgi:hypothetical protein